MLHKANGCSLTVFAGVGLDDVWLIAYGSVKKRSRPLGWGRILIGVSCSMSWFWRFQWLDDVVGVEVSVPEFFGVARIGISV